MRSLKKALADGYVVMDRHLSGERHAVIKGQLSNGYTYVVLRWTSPRKAKTLLTTLSVSHAEEEFDRLESLPPTPAPCKYTGRLFRVPKANVTPASSPADCNDTEETS